MINIICGMRIFSTSAHHKPTSTTPVQISRELPEKDSLPTFTTCIYYIKMNIRMTDELLFICGVGCVSLNLYR